MRRAAFGAAVAAAVVAALVVIRKRADAPRPPAVAQPVAAAPLVPTPSTDRLLQRARTKGSPQAPVTIIEVSDFQCPFCRQFWKETLPILEREYIATGKARFIFVNFPISQIHANAQMAHELAMCAAQQDRFWPVHDLLYQHQEQWAKLPQPTSYFLQLADSAGLNREAVAACLSSGAARTLIEADARGASQSGISSTPSFLIEGGLLPGVAPIEEWRPILDSILKTKTVSRE